ncbi:hypothetical protein [Comamonas sp.]|uniref:hypothetical protein n=1 Tax=Comamonas sp. TaxID=34028 RepID=UPI002584A18E|nr:hypothetical protein [Comamonas sp.]
MLQIATGKLFRQGVLKRNTLRGVLYTNLRMFGEEKIVTMAGQLLGVHALRKLHGHSLVYEIVELIEGDVIAPGVMSSFGIDRYLNDFAAVASFFLQITCNPDYDLVRRLTNGQSGLATNCAPKFLIKNVFESDIFISETDSLAFVEFVRQLVGLQRRTFNVVMGAIRTYVTAMHRTSDDLELSYTLLVASLESLAQKFDAHQATWLDLADESRCRIDSALSTAPAEIANAVRDAVLKNEHVKLSRRFKEFSLENLPEEFFLGDAEGKHRPIGRQDLVDGLSEAYQIRSAYVHNLKSLPHLLVRSTNFAETVSVDRKTVLTFQGLSRVVRSVIIEFVRRQPSVDAEHYPYQLETGSIVTGRWAASVWMANLDNLKPDVGRQWLEGFLEQLEVYYRDPKSAKFTDIRTAMEMIEPLLPTMKAASRLPFLTIYTAFNNLFVPEERNANAQAVIERWGHIFDTPSIEALFLHSIATLPTWDIAEHAHVLDTHIGSRSKRSGYHFPRLFDASMSLQLVERYRLEGGLEEAARRLKLASENFPEYPRMRARALEGDLTHPILWKTLLLENQE